MYIEEMQNSSLEFDYIGFGTSYDLGMGIGFTFLSVIGESTITIIKVNSHSVRFSRWIW